MSDNPIKFSNTKIDEILRITPDGKLISNHKALKPVIDRIEQLERERDAAVITLRILAAFGSELARAVLAELEGGGERDQKQGG